MRTGKATPCTWERPRITDFWEMTVRFNRVEELDPKLHNNRLNFWRAMWCSKTYIMLSTASFCWKMCHVIRKCEKIVSTAVLRNMPKIPPRPKNLLVIHGSFFRTALFPLGLCSVHNFNLHNFKLKRNTPTVMLQQDCLKCYVPKAASQHWDFSVTVLFYLFFLGENENNPRSLKQFTSTLVILRYSCVLLQLGSFHSEEKRCAHFNRAWKSHQVSSIHAITLTHTHANLYSL